MPLSEEENRLLEQMERALAAEDPKLASTLRGRTLERTARNRAVIAVLAFTAGLAMLLGGAMTQLIWLGVLGFLVMLASAVVGLTAMHGRHPASGSRATAGEATERAHRSGFTVVDGGRRRPRRTSRQVRDRRRGSFMQRVEERWERRRHEGF